MPKLNTIRAKTITAVLTTLVVGMLSLTTALIFMQRNGFDTYIEGRQGVSLRVLSFDLNSNFGDAGFEQRKKDDGKIESVVFPRLPEFADHGVVDGTAEQTSGIVSILAWDPGQAAFIRRSTSAFEADGTRYLGTVIDKRTVDDALNAGNEATLETTIAGIPYLTRMVPITTPDGVVIGALEAGVESSRMQALMRQAILLSTVLTLVIVGIAGAAFTALVPKALAPITAVNAAMRQIAQGVYDTDVPHADMPDAVGDIAQGLQSFARDLAAAETARAAQAKAQREVDEAAKRDAAVQSRVVSEITTALQQVAAGDLTTTIDSPAGNPFPAQYDDLRKGFNDALSQLNRAMSEVLATSSSLQAGAGEIDQAATDLAARAESQAATLEQSAAALNELSSSVRQSSARASEAEGSGRKTRDVAESGATVMGEAIVAMKQIAESSDRVSRIVSVIDDIAFQTNLLALNAGVEAARAGDAGKGFAVVASEVRGLAQRASNSAREIKELIDQSTAQVTDGERLVNTTGERLQEIVQYAAQLQEFVSEIASSAEEQATALSEITTSVDQLDSVTQQNAAMAEETNAAASTLSKTSEDLANALRSFRVAGQPEADVVISFERKSATRSSPALPSGENWAERAVRKRATGTDAAAPAARGADFEGF